MFPNSMSYAKWGSGDRTALLIPGGPGNEIPEGVGLRMMLSQFRPLVEAGFTVWVVTRKQNMPDGHGVEDMADDYAELIRTEFDRKVDVVLGTSYGGAIAQYLAAYHQGCFDHMLVIVAGYEVSEEGKELDYGFAKLLSEGKKGEAGTVMVNGLFPNLPFEWMARLVGAVIGRAAYGKHEHFAHDVLVEGEAEVAFDSRTVLPKIEVPVLLIAGENDVYFPPTIIEETTRLIPDCTLKMYEGKSHVGAIRDKRLTHDILVFVKR
jgi:pimeloyl-ACP methyl ester carboxylesterase